MAKCEAPGAEDYRERKKNTPTAEFNRQEKEKRYEKEREELKVRLKEKVGEAKAHEPHLIQGRRGFNHVGCFISRFVILNQNLNLLFSNPIRKNIGQSPNPSVFGDNAVGNEGDRSHGGGSFGIFGVGFHERDFPSQGDRVPIL